jgi:LPS-assembly protein
VAGVYVSPFAGLGLISQARFDQRDWTLRRQDTGITANYGPLTGTAAYTFTDFDPVTGLIDRQEEIMTTLGLKLTTNWSVLGSLRYDLDLHQRIQDSIGLKYADECFVLSATYIETFVENAALGLTPDRTVMVRFELKNIGSYTSTNGANHIFGDQNLGPKL